VQDLDPEKALADPAHFQRVGHFRPGEHSS
jgi:hypothetical protein